MDGSNVEYYAKLIRRGCEKASKVRMQTTSNTLQNLCEKGPTIILKSIKVHPNSIQFSSKFMKNPALKRDLEKTLFLFEKVIPKPGRDFSFWEPKVVQNGIRKSWKNQHRKSIQQWCPKGRKGMGHGAKMAPKIMNILYHLELCENYINNDIKCIIKAFQKLYKIEVTKSIR